MNKKYPAGLFWSGFIGDVLLRRFYLFIPAVILLIVGIWVKVCFAIGIALLVIDIVISLIDQLNIRKETLNSDDEKFAEFQNVILSDNWQENVRGMVEEKINSYESDD